MPTNFYGSGDNFHPTESPIIQAFIRRFHKAEEVGKGVAAVWGTGKAKRDFLHMDDLADACVFVMKITCEKCLSVTIPTYSHMNCFAGNNISIKDFAHLIADVVGFEGEVVFDASRPGRTSRKFMDVIINSWIGSPQQG